MPSEPWPRTSVGNRKVGPRTFSAAYVTGSFSFEAGTKPTAELCAKTTLPEVRSSAIAPVRAGAMPFACSAAPSLFPRSASPVPVRAAATEAPHPSEATISARARRAISGA